MTEREQFKFDFMAACIDRGLTTPQAMLPLAKAAMEKQALGLSTLWNAVTGTAGAAKDVASTGLSWGLPLALAAPPIAGYVGGNLAARATDIDDFDVDEAKQQELINEYHRQAERAKRQGLLRRLAQANAPSRSRY